MAKKNRSILDHPDFYFKKHYITSTSNDLDILKKDSLESHFWVYELHSQVQKRAGNHCILKGGAATQLYLPRNLQRCTADLDCATDLSPEELNRIMSSISSSYRKNNFHTSYKEYIPKNLKPQDRIIPMMTFIFDIPFIFKTKWKSRHPGIKMDFLFLDTQKLHKKRISNAETLGLTLSYKPMAIDIYSTISDKLITLASKTIGLERYKIEGLYKNIYDLYCLINTYNDLESFKIVSKRIKESLLTEIENKNAKYIDIDILLNDIMSTIFDISTFSLIRSSSELPFEVVKFQENYLQKEMRSMLNTDMWSIMCFYIYIWVFSLKNYILKDDYSNLNGINIVIDKFDSYLTLGKKERREFKAELKKNITLNSPNLILEGTGNPLRLIYLDYILTNMRPEL